MDRLIIGYGYLARYVGAAWQKRGDRVMATTRKTERFVELHDRGVEPLLWDVRTSTNELPAADTVLYCVGFDRRAGVPMREIYVDGLRRTLERLPPPKRLIYISSTGVYGNPGGEWVDETTPPQPSDPSGETCLEAEEVVADYVQSTKTPVTVLRFAGIYGPGRTFNAQDLREGKPIVADPDAHLNLIHGADGGQVVQRIADHPEPASLYLVADGHPVLRRDFYSHMANLLKAPEPRFGSAVSDGSRRLRGDRRISIARLRADMQPAFQFPDYRAGLQDALSSV